MPGLAARIAVASSGDTIELDPGEYDDANPIVIEKRLQIKGPIDAIVHSEFVIYNSYVRFDGFTMEMNKEGAPSRTGVVWPFPQNGMVTALNSQFWADDVDFRMWRPNDWAASGYPYLRSKCAIHAIGGKTRVNALTRKVTVDWRGNNRQVIEQHYGGVLYLIDNSPQDASVEILPGTTTQYGAAVSGVNADIIMSGVYIRNNGASDWGVSGARDSYIQVGAGKHVEIDKPIPVLLDETSRKWIAPGCLG